MPICELCHGVQGRRTFAVMAELDLQLVLSLIGGLGTLTQTDGCKTYEKGRRLPRCKPVCGTASAQSVPCAVRTRSLRSDESLTGSPTVLAACLKDLVRFLRTDDPETRDAFFRDRRQEYCTDRLGATNRLL